jgi:hypothetical protein
VLDLMNPARAGRRLLRRFGQARWCVGGTGTEAHFKRGSGNTGHGLSDGSVGSRTVLQPGRSRKRQGQPSPRPDRGTI